MKIDYDLATPSWEDSHRYGPAPRWRRRILRNLISGLKDISTACDVGCAQPFLMLDMKKLGLKVSGCDISKPVIEENAKTYPDMDFFLYDLNKSEKMVKNGTGGGTTLLRVQKCWSIWETTSRQFGTFVI